MSDGVELSVKAWYNPPKAQLFSDRQVGIKILRGDLLALKMPHPKAENVKFHLLPNGTTACHFTWPDASRNGVLYKHLKNRICPESPERKEAFKEMITSLSISDMNFQEVDHIHKYTPRRNATNAHNSRSYDHDGSHPHQRSIVERQDVSDSREIPARGHGQKQNSNIDEAQTLLDDMASTLRIPKQEPVDFLIPPIMIRDDSIASSAPSIRGSSLPRCKIKPPPEDDAPISLSAIAPASPLLNLPQASGTTPTQHNHHVQSYTNGQSSLVPPATAHQRSASSSPPPGLRFTTKSKAPPPVLPPNPAPPLLLPRQPSQAQPLSQPHISLKRSRSPSSSGLNSHPFTRRPPPNPRDLPQIQKLTRELWGLRRQVTADLARESAIISELRSLNSAFVPEASTTQIGMNGSAGKEDSVMKTRLQMVERELMQERMQRIRAEETLKDIQRECREPFVVPALFEAFLMISNVTSQVMNTGV